jgi:glyoxylase-like metal-dependent hydrolase (beta-lactamase superfamily II)
MGRLESALFVKQFQTGGDRNFGYLAADPIRMEALVVDPSPSPEAILEFALDEGFSVKYLFNTHGHSDHTSGNALMEKAAGIQPLGFGAKDPATGLEVRDGARFPLGDLELTIIHTPGHTPDSICLHAGDALFTGDTLFVGKVGGTDSSSRAGELYHSLHEKLMILPDGTRVYPGHDYGSSPESTIGRESRENPFLLQPDLRSFVHLKNNWAEYKKRHGID